MIRLIVLALLCGGVSSGSHSLRYFYTSMTPMHGLLDFVVVGYVDDAQFVLYDSDRKQMIPRQRWMESEAPEYWEQQTWAAQRWEERGKNDLAILMSRTNQTDGIHTFQVMYGCELRDDGSTAGFYQYGWDGKDLISFDKERLVWVTPVTWAEDSKRKWNQDSAGLQQDKGYLEQECIDWLKKYLRAGERELKPVAPRVFPSVNKASNIRPTELSCLVTGFYPRDIEVTLLRNGQPITDTESTGILPNHDGTYQLVRWAQIELDEGATYSCRYDQGYKAGPEIRHWDGTFPGSPGSPEGTNLGLIVGIVIGAVALIVLAIGVVVWRRRG